MAAGKVVWENLKRTLDSPEVEKLLLLKEALDNLRIAVRDAEGAMVALEGRDHVHSSLRNLVPSHDQPELGNFSGLIAQGRLENISTWLYQADDLLDQILTYDQRTSLCRGRDLMQQGVNAMARIAKEVSLFLSASKQIVFPKVMADAAVQVKKISNEIETLVGQLRNELDNANHPERTHFKSTEWTRPAQNSVIGREDEKKDILRMLLRPSSNMSNVSVIYMSGLPGVGKSVLAKDIYEDHKVKTHFDLRMWIPVSQITDERKIIREIVESCTNRRSNYRDNSQSADYHNSRVHQNGSGSLGDILGCRSSGVAISSPNNSARQNETDKYERRLRKEIKGKLYLLILDDVCLQQWQSLGDLLAGGAKGSRILVTTQFPKIAGLVSKDTIEFKACPLKGLKEDTSWALFKSLASNTNEVKAYPLEGLKKYNSWAVFKSLALNRNEPFDSEKKKIAFEIADICEYLPLTIKVAARFLQGRNKGEWATFKEGLKLVRDQNQDVMQHVLHLSCSDLPTHLRACFGYCSLFPSEFTFNKHDLISLWIAQGFVNPQDAQRGEEGFADPENGQSVNPQEDLRGEEVVGNPEDGHSVNPQEGLRGEEVVGNPEDGHSDNPQEGLRGEEVIGNPEDGHSVNPVEALSLEQVGDTYFMELSRRCLFEEVSTDELGNILTCKMHHIVGNVAAKFTAGVAQICMTDSYMNKVPDPTTKHVSVNCQGYSSLKLSSPLLKGPNTRTLIFVKEPDCDIQVDTVVCNQLISSFKRLRVLDLHDLGLKELPESIGEQIHLRYLDLSKSDGLVTLPMSFNKLYNLQTLKLNSCPKLKKLPSDFGLLVNLKRLEVDGCDSLTCMPSGLEKLTQLETLSRFVVGKESSKQTTSVGLKALSRLEMLKGRLAIEFKGNWMTNILKANPAELKGEWLKKVTKLSEVKIRWAHSISAVEVPSEDEILAQAAILEQLQPNKNLKILCIEGYKGGNFPSWASVEKISSSLPNLVHISIEGCGKCEFLPLFGELKHLRKLTLRHMTNVQYFETPTSGREVTNVRNIGTPTSGTVVTNVQNFETPTSGTEYVVQDPALPSSVRKETVHIFESLEELTLHNFYKLEGWQREVASEQQAETQFPCLLKLRIWNCPNLRSLPSFPKVTDLKLRNVNQLLLDDCARKAPSLKNKIQTRTLQIKGCPNLNFQAVKTGLGGLPSLKQLVIEKCDTLSSLASDLQNLTSLESLKISSCRELDLSQDSSPTFSAYRCSPWVKLKFLRELSLVEIPKMETLPEWLKHIKTLKLLWISGCQSLRSLPEWIDCLSALQQLRIESCRDLKRLPAGLKNVRTLMKVEITECPELMERCREHTGEDWPYIEHARVLLHKSWRYGYVS